jgi:hypothetical protein
LLASNAFAQTDNSNGMVTCNTITKGVVKFKPSLTSAGGFPGTVQISGVLGDCTTDVAGVTLPEGKSKFKGVLNSADNGCGGLSGPSTSTGTITITWGTIPAVTNKVSTVTISSGGSAGGFSTIVGALRGTFDLGTSPPANGGPTSALAVAGGFTGGDGGATSGATVVTQQSVGSILFGCGSTTGLKSLNIGAGALRLK